MDNLTKFIKPGHEIKNECRNMHVKDLKKILDKLPDDLPIVIPVIDEDDANHISGFRYVRTAGELISEGEREPEVLCLNAAADGHDIADQVYFSGRDVGVKSVLFGTSKFENLSEADKKAYIEKKLLKQSVRVSKEKLL